MSNSNNRNEVAEEEAHRQADEGHFVLQKVPSLVSTDQLAGPDEVKR